MERENEVSVNNYESGICTTIFNKMALKSGSNKYILLFYALFILFIILFCEILNILIF